MRNAFYNRLLLSAAVAALSLGSTQVMASGGADTQWATVDNHGFLGIDLMVQGGYSFGSSDLTYGQFYDYTAPGGANYGFDVDTGDGFNGKAGVDARFEGGWHFGLIYSGIRTSEKANSGTFDNSNVGFSWPVNNVLGNSATSYNEISVKTDVHVNVVDLTIGRDVGLGGNTLVVTSGLRYGSIEQITKTDLWCSAFKCGTRSLENSDQLKSTYTGYGPILGASYSMPISTNGLSAFGSVLGSILYGEQKTSRWDSGSATTTRNNDKHFAYTADAEAGISYKLPSHPMTLSMGYQVTYMDRVRDTTNGTGYTGTESYGSSKDDILYHGPFARLVISLP